MKSNLWISIAVLAAIIGAGIYWGTGFFGASSIKLADTLPLRPDDRNTVSFGSKIYQKQCASCHGVNLEGQPNWKGRLPNGRLPAPPHDKTGHTWHHNDELLFKITKFGSAALAGADYQTDMRGYKDELSDAEIIAVLSYIKSTWPEQIRKRHDGMNKSN